MDRLCLGSRRELGDDHALAGETDDEPFFFERGVSAADGHRGNAELPGRLPDGRQMLPRDQAPHADVMNHLVFDLEINRQTARAVDRQYHAVPHDLTQAVLVHYHSCRFRPRVCMRFRRFVKQSNGMSSIVILFRATIVVQ